ncbi:dipeptidase [Corynebacterium lizhenjunii]|uniref:dipeptidase n=1 Tax=Corynebacterium lizhenjunii TaxID=2709394 RepID=UPI0013E9FA37|nr:dipeptidase [Corynebacterium lizhenjunii]
MSSSTTDTAQAVRTFIEADRERIFSQLAEIVAFNSVHNEPGCEADNAAAAQWVQDRLREAGFAVEAIATTDGSTALLGTKSADAADAPTVLLYSHYDVVPAGDHAAWESHPFELTERPGAAGNPRWYGRGAADCKGNLVMHLAALRAVEAAGGTRVNVKVLIEGSEERGGEGLSHLIATRPELFAADVILIADAGNAKAGQPTLTTSLRGGAQIEVRVDTLSAAVHSGQFGGAAPDAVKALMRAIDSLTDDYGRTVIDGVDCSGVWPGQAYPPEDFAADAQMLPGTEIMGAGDPAGATPVADMIWARPAISVTGFSSTPVEQAVNAVPATAAANLNLRTPATMDPQATAEAVCAHLEAHVPWGAKLSWSIKDANRGFETDPDKPAAKLLAECLADAYSAGQDSAQDAGRSAGQGSAQDAAPVSVSAQGMGGSIPLTVELQEAFPEAEIALFGVEEPQCTIHSANESVDPEELSAIAIAEALFLTRL